MKDSIFFGNLKGLLKCGKWTFTAEEAMVFTAIYEELERRLKPPPPLVPKVQEEPVKKEKPKNKEK